jgi:cytochrome c-type biogenesis protein CcmH
MRRAEGGGTMRFRLALRACALLAALAGASALAAEAPEVGDNPAVEHHMMALAAELRCLQCQNQTLADSEAPLAVDLRRQIREMISQGRSDADIKDYLAARYGDFVFYRPPVEGKTLLLWYGPAVILGGGLLALFLALRRRNARIDAQAAQGGAPISGPEAVRARRLLAGESDEESAS